MSQLTLGLLLISLACTLGWIIIFFLFRKTFVLRAGTLIAIAIVITANLSYFIGVRGLHHMIWTAPVCLFAVLVVMYTLSIKVKSPIKELTALITLISQKNLDVKVDNKLLNSKYEIKDLADAVNTLLTSQQHMINNLKRGSEKLLDSSNRVNDSSKSTKEGSQKQAISMEQILSSINNINKVVQNNSQNIIKSNTISQDSYSLLRSLNITVQDSVKLMNNIYKEIESVTGLSSQIKLLGLNASIEASGAGELGKGFSVLAKEVSYLAESSGQSSSKITDLIHGGVIQIENLKNKQEEVTKRMKESSKLLSNVAIATKEIDRDGMLIGNSVKSLVETVQVNANKSEHMSEVADGILELSKQLSNIVEKFKLN